MKLNPKIMLFLTLLLTLSAALAILFNFNMPYSYLQFSFMISIILVLTVFFSKEKHLSLSAILACIFILCIFLSGLYLISSHFSLIPLDDGYRDYATAKIFLENDQIFIIDPSVNEVISYSSGWPLLHTLAVAVSNILDIDLLHTVLILPLVFSAIKLLFLFILTKKIVQELGVSRIIVPVVLLLYSISPDNIYTSMQFVRQSFSLVFVFLLFYILYSHIQARAAKFQIKICFFFFCFVLVLSHDFTPFTILIFLTIFFILSKTAQNIIVGLRRKVAFIKFSTVRLETLGFLCIGLMIYWLIFSPMVLTTYLPFLRGIGLNPYTGTIDLASIRWTFYNVLSSSPYSFILTFRDLAIYIPVLIGFIAFFINIRRRRKITSTEQFLLYSTISLSLIFVLYEFVLDLQPLRLLWFAAPFISIFAALFYYSAFFKKKYLAPIITSIVLVILVFSTFLAPFSRGYFPLYLYDPEISFEQVGNHNPNYTQVISFVENELQLDSFKRILSDDPDLLYIILSSDYYADIENLYAVPNAINDTNVILFEFMDLNPSFHSLPYLYQQNKDVLDNLDNFKSEVTDNFKEIYNDGYSRILVRQNSIQG